MHPLQPLSHGNVLIVGVKSSNFNDEIRTHPRVIIWDSQQQHWTDKTLPTNTRAIFVTRFIGHTTFGKIIKEARKKQITIFNPEGTGIIARQVKELLNMTPPIPETITPIESTKQEETTDMTKKPKVYGKLRALIPFIDFSKNNRENARSLELKCKEIGITSTPDSLANFVGEQRRGSRKSQSKVVKVQSSKLDVSVEILDGMIRELTDMREYLVAVTRENQSLKAKVDKFKRFFDE